MAKYPAWSIEMDCGLSVLWHKQVGLPTRQIEFVLPNRSRYVLEIAAAMDRSLIVRFFSVGKKPFTGRWWMEIANSIFTFCTETDHSPYCQGCGATYWVYNEKGSPKSATMTLVAADGIAFLDRLFFVQALVGFIVGKLESKAEWLD